jgi:hypothetical protein
MRANYLQTETTEVDQTPMPISLGAVIDIGGCVKLKVVEIDFPRPREWPELRARVICLSGPAHTQGTVINTPFGYFQVWPGKLLEYDVDGQHSGGGLLE